MYAPMPPQLVRVREHIVETWPEVRRITSSKAFKAAVEEMHGDRLTRVPRGFPADHPAAEYLKHRQFLAAREFPAALATDPAFYPTVVNTFKAIVPLVRFLNAPLADRDPERR
jgi:uncharacterized protein (DUF2461 family)